MKTKTKKFVLVVAVCCCFGGASAVFYWFKVKKENEDKKKLKQRSSRRNSWNMTSIEELEQAKKVKKSIALTSTKKVDKTQAPKFVLNPARQSIISLTP